MVSVIITKLSKPTYDTSKAFSLIVLLNTLSKHIETIIVKQLQFDAIKYSILHSNQPGDVVQQFTEDAGILSGMVHTGVEVCRIDSETSKLVE